MLESLLVRLLAVTMLVALMAGMIHGLKLDHGDSEVQPITKDNFDFSAWNSLIQRYVVPGVIDGVSLNMVDYDKISLDADYLKVMMQLETANTTGFTWSQYHAFWINTYNFAIVRIVIEHPCKQDLFPGGCGPITSIRQCGIQQPSATVVVWDQRVTTVANQEMSISDIVQKLHAPPAPWNVDPRYHSALSAAAVSAPDLSTAFGYPNAELLDRQLNQSMQSWLHNPLKGSVLNIAANELLLSATFKWDLVDWTANGRSIWWWLHQYGTPLMKAYRGTPTIDYMKFDWALNGDVGALCGASNRPCYPWWGLLITLVSATFIILIICIYCYCARAIKRKAFRDYIKANEVVPNETDQRWTEIQ